MLWCSHEHYRSLNQATHDSISFYWRGFMQKSHPKLYAIFRFGFVYPIGIFFERIEVYLFSCTNESSMSMNIEHFAGIELRCVCVMLMYFVHRHCSSSCHSTSISTAIRLLCLYLCHMRSQATRNKQFRHLEILMVTRNGIFSAAILLNKICLLMQLIRWSDCFTWWPVRTHNDSIPVVYFQNGCHSSSCPHFIYHFNLSWTEMKWAYRDNHFASVHTHTQEKPLQYHWNNYDCDCKWQKELTSIEFV